MTLQRALLASWDRESEEGAMADAPAAGGSEGSRAPPAAAARAAAHPQPSLPSSRPSLSTQSLGISRASGASLLKRSVAMERRGNIVQHTSLADKVMNRRVV